MNDTDKETILTLYKDALKLKKTQNLGQRKITRILREKFKVEVNENTVSGWLYNKNVPFAQEKTQFKPKPSPKKEILQNLYYEKKFSASNLAKKFGVSTVIAINWLKQYGVKPRSHLESMNTYKIKAELRSKQLIKPKNTRYQTITPEKAYVLGVLCGDAHINNKSIRLEIRYDTEFIEEFLWCVKKVYGNTYNYKYYKPRNSYVAYVSSELICKDLLKYGKFGTFEWRVPQAIMLGTKTLAAHFLKGYIDSEGCVQDYKIDAASVNLDALKDVKLLLAKLGINGTIYSGKKYHTIVISRKENIRKFMDEVGITIHRKNQRLHDMYNKWQ